MDRDVGIGRRALGRVWENVGTLLRAGVHLLKLYLEFVVVGGMIFLLFYVSVFFGVKTNLMKSKITFFNIEISRLSSEMDEIESRMKLLESKARILYEFERNGKKYRILEYEREEE